MRQVVLTEECLAFINGRGKRLELKFEQLVQVMIKLDVVHSNFVKKLQNTNFYELRIKAGNEYRVILFTLDHLNFTEARKIICLTAFLKKSSKDYLKAIQKAEKLLNEYLKEDVEDN